MENTSLYSQKVTILGRLIKESSLTLEEALVLLKEEEVTAPAQTTPSPWIPGTTTPWTQPIGTNPFPLGSIGNPWYGSTSDAAVSFSTTSGTSTVMTDVDLNN